MTDWIKETKSGNIPTVEYDWNDSVMTWDGIGAWDAGNPGTVWTKETKH